jgi:hypothetical protein
MGEKIIPLEEKAIAQSVKPTDQTWIEQTQMRGGTFNTVEIGYIELELHRNFPFWNFEIMEGKQVDDQIVVLGKLTIEGRDNKGEKVVITKMQYGSADVKRFSVGDKKGQMMDLANDYKSAASDSLKKCSSLLGIAFDVYHPKVYKKLVNLVKTDKAIKAPRTREKQEMASLPTQPFKMPYKPEFEAIISPPTEVKPDYSAKMADLKERTKNRK